jgi:two-component system nitrate/nitrite response regulator NarL
VIDVVIADPHPLFRDALARVMHQDPELRVAAEAGDGRAALAAIRRHEPAVAVLARELTDLDGDRLLLAVRRSHPSTRVLMLDADPGPGIWDLLGHGAAGILSRRVTADVIRRSVHRVARGGTALCDDVQAALATEVRARRPHEPSLLTPREQQVLELVAEGLSSPAIAQQLQLGTTTVRTHLGHLYDKLGVHDRAQLVREAMRRNLLV